MALTQGSWTETTVNGYKILTNEETATTSDVSYSGSGYITAVSMTGRTEDSATFSLTIEGTGVLTQAIQ